MFKNIIIAVLVVIILNLLVQNKQNVDIPSLQIQKEPFSEGSDIQEDTFFEEKK